ncbi:hypothetical protein A3K02_01560 [candidate division WS6 bacterium RIFOXYD1_FULL_33_8]|nr:MAG: transcription elongation factor GreA, transcription elongation factor GreA [candidate division WS6 bacterium GW2011_GWF1_33_233]KKP55429.1 MAG: transcription elongation factor GreA, transcription elongation factor GreA [candidate division WS6 bacterium GW2011_WS6_33_547]OGC35991.1 MAG: hypothetical protein A2369_02795 [candidate division WS6 bacterium RIFOXYB1_FULL_33_15]OGC36911.1 MAG: hypothetical protein A2436_00160 [candidate division WS6 bacterium RIFOXYC1_FULL_33_9]OGC42291.1 MAG:
MNMENVKPQITVEKKYELIEELKRLYNVVKKEIADRLEQSRKDNLSEDDAQLGVILEEKESVDNRIDEISDILENADIIKDKKNCEPGKIEIGSVVKLKQGDKVLDIKLVSSLEADPLKNYLSDKSPLGRKLLKAKIGDTVNVKIRGTETEYKILEVC